MVDLKSLFGGKKEYTDEKKEAPKGLEKKIKFAMWWVTDKDRIFLKSKTRKILRELYETLDGVESYMFANLCEHFKLVEGEHVRIALPEQRAVFIVDSPLKQKMMLCVSREKGIQFKFDPKSTSPEARDDMLLLFLEGAKGLKKEVLKNKVPLDTYADHRPLGWFKLLEKSNERGVTDGSETMYIGAEV